LAAAVMSLVTCSVVVATLAFAVGDSLSAWTIPLTTIATGAWVWWWSRREVPGRAGITAVGVMAAAVLVVVIGALMGGVVLDTTYDGRWFHREAIIQLADGWNPLSRDLTASEVPESAARGRINGYPKAPWILAAALFALSGRIECASAFSFALMIAAAATVFAATVGLERLGRRGALAVAAVAALNPIAVCQLTNPLIDGQVASILLIVVAAGVLLYRTGSGLALVVLFMAVVVGVNTKQSALPFVLIVVAGLVVTAAVVDGRLPRRRHMGVLGAAFVIGVVGIGAHPHLTNLVRHQNWAYPFKSKVVTGFNPRVTEESRIGRIEGFLKSAFSRSQHDSSLPSSRSLLANEARLKLPFSVRADELAQFRIQGVRIGGGGPLYGAMVVAALLAMVGLLWFHPDRAGLAALFVVFLALSVLAFPYTWVFRLVPHSWLLPLVPAAACMTSARRSVAALGWAVLVIGAVNISLVSWVCTTAAARHSSFLHERIAALAGGSPVAVDFGRFRAERLRLTDHGVDFFEVHDAGHWLGLYLGWSLPNVTAAEPRSVDGDPSLQLEWLDVRGALSYAVELIEAPPAGPGGGGLTVHSRRVQATGATIPRPAGCFFASVSACNHLGCGPAVTHGPLDGTTEDRRRPILGLPSPGDALQTPVLLSWIPVSEAVPYRVVIEDADTMETVIDTITDDRFFLAKLAPDRRWRLQVVAQGAGGDAATRTVEFRTTTLRSPELLEPVIGSMVAEGQVTLRWTPVDWAIAYEYLVTKPGHRRPVARAVTTEPTARVTLSSRDGPTLYSAIVRACPEGATCRGGRDRGWGQWSTLAGTGATNFTVVPATDMPGAGRIPELP